jgi:hypothetical protein
MSWELGAWGVLTKALFVGLAIGRRDRGQQEAPEHVIGTLVPAPDPEPLPPPVPQGIPLIATDPPSERSSAPVEQRSSAPTEPPRKLKAPHLALVAARRFHAHMLEIGEAGPLRSGTVYGLYVEWATEDEGRAALPDNVFLATLATVPGAEKRQTKYDLRGNLRRSFRWWFEVRPTLKARRERADAVMHTAKPKRKRAKKRRAR